MLKGNDKIQFKNTLSCSTRLFADVSIIESGHRFECCQRRQCGQSRPMRLQQISRLDSGRDIDRDFAVQHNFPEPVIRNRLFGRNPNRSFAARASDVSDADKVAVRSGDSNARFWRIATRVFGKGVESGYRTSFVARKRLDSIADVRAVRCLGGLLGSSNCIPAFGRNAGFRKSRQTGNPHLRMKETAIPARLERHAHEPTRPTV